MNSRGVAGVVEHATEDWSCRYRHEDGMIHLQRGSTGIEDGRRSVEKGDRGIQLCSWWCQIRGLDQNTSQGLYRHDEWSIQRC